MPDVSELLSQILLKKLREEELSSREAAILAEWEGRSPDHAAFIAMLMDEASLSDKIKSMLEVDEQGAWQRIERALEAEWNERSGLPKRKISWYKYAVAASVILVLGFGVYYFLNSKSPVSEPSNATVADIAPGGNRAMLVLSDGSVIDLDKAPDGTIAAHKGFNVMKAGGRLTLSKTAADNIEDINPGNISNMLSTPRGGQYQVELPDGTTVWLNAASSLRFPDSFSDNERIVQLNGEAYFEVAKDYKKRFKVIVDSANGLAGAEIEALGTHFNIKAFDEEEALVTTLLEGKIRLSADRKPGLNNSKTQKHELILNMPGQQATLNPLHQISFIGNADTAIAIAWKDGYFNFHESGVSDVMNQIARWYNVSIVYQDPINQSLTITGKVTRNVSLKNLLKILNLTEIYCEIETSKDNTPGGGRIVVKAVK